MYKVKSEITYNGWTYKAGDEFPDGTDRMVGLGLLEKIVDSSNAKTVLEQTQTDTQTESKKRKKKITTEPEKTEEILTDNSSNITVQN
jgi:hypothetical protein